MGSIETFSLLCIAVLAVYIIVTCFRWLLPRNIIQKVSTSLNDAKQCLTSAETVDAISPASEYRASLETLASDLARLRIESHRSPGFFQQIWLASRCGLTYRLYYLASQIRALKMRVEMVMDEQLVTPQNVVNERLPHRGGADIEIVIPAAHSPDQASPRVILVH